MTQRPLSTLLSFSGPGYFTSDNVDRIEIAKGPVGLFYGNSAPSGVSNTITKRPQYVNRSQVEISAGSYGYEKAVVDTQLAFSHAMYDKYARNTEPDGFIQEFVEVQHLYPKDFSLVQACITSVQALNMQVNFWLE